MGFEKHVVIWKGTVFRYQKYVFREAEWKEAS